MTAPRLPFRRIDGNVTYGAQKIGWYRLAPQRWSFRSETEREEQVTDLARRLAALQKHRLWWRVTSRPADLRRWETVHRDTARHPRGAGWSPLLDETAAHVRRMGFAEKTVFLGVNLPVPPAVLARIAGRPDNLERLRGEIDRTVAGSGLNGRRATQAEIEWLTHRSVRLGCSHLVPSGLAGEWVESDMAEFAAGADWAGTPVGRTLTVTVDKTSFGSQQTRHVAILAVGRMAEPVLHDPWLARADGLPFPVEAAFHMRVLDSKKVVKEAEKVIRKVRYQAGHTDEHGLPLHHSLAPAEQTAIAIQRGVEAGMSDLETRVDLWAKFAVFGDTPEEALDRGKELAERYGSAVTIHRLTPSAARAFLPGAPVTGGGAFRRRMKVTTAAVGMPARAARVGHDTGIFVGYTSGGAGRHPVMWDTHRDMEGAENRSGLTVIAGGLGAGKSFLAGDIVVQSVLDGVRWFVLDPSGPLAGMCDIPEIAPFAAHIDLLSAKPGVLNPFSIVRDPNRANYHSDDEYDQARVSAEESRRQLCADTFNTFLPVALQSTGPTLVALGKAADMVAADRSTSPLDVVGALRRLDGAYAEHAGHLADFLTRVSRQPTGRLVFPTGNPNLDYRHDLDAEDARLTVVTMRGLALPKTLDKAHWTVEQARNVPLFNLTGHRLQQQILAADRNQRKGFFSDEAYVFAGDPLGQSLLVQLSKDNRKHDIRVLLAAHSVSEVLVEGVELGVGSVFQGLAKDPAAQTAALVRMGVPLNVGYEKVIGGLTKNGDGHEFLFFDGDYVERIRVVMPVPAIRDPLITTPGHARTLSVVA